MHRGMKYARNAFLGCICLNRISTTVLAQYHRTQNGWNWNKPWPVTELSGLVFVILCVRVQCTCVPERRSIRTELTLTDTHKSMH
mgnify:CR=1 FL=1